jgi:hypothetical protein
VLTSLILNRFLDSVAHPRLQISSMCPIFDMPHSYRCHHQFELASVSLRGLTFPTRTKRKVLTEMKINTLPLTQSHTSTHPGSTAQHAGHGFFDSLLRGFAWRMGGDTANAIFHMAPGLIVLAVLGVLVFLGVRWLRRRNS